MPSPPSPPPVRAEVHRQRAVAESFGVDPARYDRARPPYPATLVERIVAAGRARSGADGPPVALVDVGCGTGIEARQFLAAGCRVLGVEPDGRMAEFARGTGVEVEVATFESWDPADRFFDAVVAGQFWHWVDPVTGAAKAAQVLRPGGRLAVFWHVFAPPDDVAEAFATAFHRAVPDAPFDFRSMGPATDMYQ